MEITKEDRILITGGYGFLGRFTFIDLVKNGYNNVFQYGGKKDGWDLGESAHVGWLFEDVRPDVVIHLAEKNGDTAAYYPGGVMFENLNMSIRVIEEARQYDVKKFITVANYNCYPHACPIPVREEDLWNGYPTPSNSCHAVAKRTFFEMTEAYDKQFDTFNAVNLILADLYGPDDHFHSGALKFISSLLVKINYFIENNITLSLEGRASAVRDFLFVRDAAKALRLSMEECNNSFPINIGSGESYTIYEVVEMCCNIMEYRREISWRESSIDGPLQRFLDTNKAEQEIGFKAETSLHEGLTKTISWVKDNLSSIRTYAPDQAPPRRR